MLALLHVQILSAVTDADWCRAAYCTALLNPWNVQTFANESLAKGNAVAVSARNELFVVGTTWGPIGGQAHQGAEDMVMLKYDPTGQLNWARASASSEPKQPFVLSY